MDSLQERFYQIMPYVVTGQFLAPKAWRDNVTGVAIHHHAAKIKPSDTGRSASGVRREIGSVLHEGHVDYPLARDLPSRLQVACDSVHRTRRWDRRSHLVAMRELMNCDCWTNTKMSVIRICQGHALTATNSGGIRRIGPVPQWPGKEIGDTMRRVFFEFQNALLRRLGATTLALLIGIGGAIAQSGDLRAQDQSKQAQGQPQQPAADPLKDSQKKTDEFAEAAQAINGPAGNPECVWLGRRVVVLMWRDDLDTAFRHRAPLFT